VKPEYQHAGKLAVVEQGLLTQGLLLKRGLWHMTQSCCGPVVLPQHDPGCNWQSTTMLRTAYMAHSKIQAHFGTAAFLCPPAHWICCS
jgi:hypothetical protein